MNRNYQTIESMARYFSTGSHFVISMENDRHYQYTRGLDLKFKTFEGDLQLPVRAFEILDFKKESVIASYECDLEMGGFKIIRLMLRRGPEINVLVGSSNGVIAIERATSRPNTHMECINPLFVTDFDALEAVGVMTTLCGHEIPSGIIQMIMKGISV